MEVIRAAATAISVQLAIAAAQAGAEALLCAGPPYNKPTQQGVLAHIRAVAHATCRPSWPPRSVWRRSRATRSRVDGGRRPGRRPAPSYETRARTFSTFALRFGTPVCS
jgi:dihydrodipicolinate synthetase family protein